MGSGLCFSGVFPSLKRDLKWEWKGMGMGSNKGGGVPSEQGWKFSLSIGLRTGSQRGGNGCLEE
jgi:hypothetical protein